MVESAPSSVDLQDFQFKLHSKLRIFDSVDDSKFKSSASLLAAASRFGLVFIGTPSGTLEIVQIKTIESCNLSKVESTSFAKRSIPLPSIPTHLALNCDQTLLAVVVTNDGCASAVIYGVHSFLSQNIGVVREIRVSVTSGVSVLETCWNPAMPTCYTACKSDGSLGVYNLTETGVDINEIPAMARATCFCWSPKGKQIVVGSANGTLTQYKPDLKAVKAIPAPALGGSGHFSIINVFWVTNYQFVAIYKDASEPAARPSILIVNAPKAGAITYINYDDICYSYGTLRPPQYYMIHQPTWGVFLVASANSMEVGVLGICQSGEPALWQQWNQIDAGRAELPLSASHQETFPVGFAFDTGIHLQLPWGENQSLPPMPMIHLLSHHGVMCSFNVINIRQGAATICTSPEPIADQSGLGQFIVPVPVPVPVPVQAPAPPVHQPPPVQQQITAQAPIYRSQTPPASMMPSQNTTMLFKPETASSGIPSFSSPATTANTMAIPKQTSQANTLFSGATPSLFGTTPNFGAALPTATSAAGGLNFKLPAVASTASMFGGLTTAPKMASPNFGAITPGATPPINFSSPGAVTTPSGPNSQFSSSLFGSSTASPSIKPPGFGSTNMPSSFGSLTPKTSATGNVTPIQLPMPRPAGQPLLATPKDIAPKLSKPEPSNETPKRVEDNSVNEEALQNLIKDEVKNFTSELKELFFRCKNIQLKVGTEEEKSFLVLTTDSLLEFYKELQEITDGQVTEVHYLKQALMQSFAWYEDTKSRHRRYADPNFATLLQSQELDPISEKQLADIQHLLYYIEAQLKQVDGFLDNQWADFQDSCKKHIKGKLQMPTLEPVYQSLVRQNAILDKQRYILKDIGARIKSRHRKQASYPQVMNLASFNLNKSDNNFQLDEELRKLKIDSGDLFTARYERICKNQRAFTNAKQKKLCSFFSNRSVAHIAPRKPKFANTMVLTTPTKSSSFQSPTAQRSLGQTFERIIDVDDSLNRSADTNISASNLFSFSLFEGVSKKAQPAEKLNVIQMLKTPESQAFKPSTMSPKLQSNIFNVSAASGPVFNFTAPQTTIPQNKPQLFTSNSTTPQPVTNFSFGSNITITSVSAATAEKPKPAPNFSFSISNAAPSLSKTVEAPLVSKVSAIKIPTIQSPDAKLSIVKTPSTTDAIQFGIATPEVKSQPFTFIVPKPIVSEPIIAKPIEDAREGFDETSTGFSFGSALSLGQQSTPKSKTATAALSFGQTPTSLSAQTTQVATSSQIVVPKPTFGLPTQVSATPQSITSIPVSKVEAASSPLIFGELLSSTAEPSFAQPASSNPPTGITSIFGGATTTNTLFAAQPQTTSIFAPKTETTPETPTSSFNFVHPAPKSLEPPNTPTSAASLGLSNFTPKLDTTPETPTSSLGLAQVTPKNTAPEKTSPTPSSFSFVQNTPKTTSDSSETTPATHGFSFLQSATPVLSEPVKSASIFGGAASNMPANIGPGASTNTTSGFSFLRSAIASTTATPETTATPKISSVFSLADINASEASAVDFSTTKTTQELSSFGFDSLTVSSPENKFSFGNLTVSALSPNASTTTTVSTANTGSFSFALPAASTATTATFGFGGGSVFGKAAATTTASFMAQPICSPSTAFSQNTSPSAFGQATGNIFAQKPNVSSSTGGSIFGQSGTVFGGAGNVPVTTSASIFGQVASSPFGSPAQAAQTGTTQTGSMFGQNNLGFGTAATSTGSIFGQNNFGAPAATSASSSFSFTQNANAANSSFSSSGGSIFGAKPSFGQPAPVAFGQPFGSSPAFGTPSTPQQSPGGFAGGATGGEGGFGSPSAFGVKPAFGSPPAFGQSAFGAPPAFGGSPSFGSPQRVFGSSPPQGGMPPPFGGQENSTFANLANQSTLGFGSLAQNQQVAAPPPQASQFSGGSQFSSWR